MSCQIAFLVCDLRLIMYVFRGVLIFTLILMIEYCFYDLKRVLRPVFEFFFEILKNMFFSSKVGFWHQKKTTLNL